MVIDDDDDEHDHTVGGDELSSARPPPAVSAGTQLLLHDNYIHSYGGYTVTEYYMRGFQQSIYNQMAAVYMALRLSLLRGQTYLPHEPAHMITQIIAATYFCCSHFFEICTRCRGVRCRICLCTNSFFRCCICQPASRRSRRLMERRESHPSGNVFTHVPAAHIGYDLLYPEA